MRWPASRCSGSLGGPNGAAQVFVRHRLVSAVCVALALRARVSFCLFLCLSLSVCLPWCSPGKSTVRTAKTSRPPDSADGSAGGSGYMGTILVQAVCSALACSDSPAPSDLLLKVASASPPQLGDSPPQFGCNSDSIRTPFGLHSEPSFLGSESAQGRQTTTLVVRGLGRAFFCLPVCLPASFAASASSEPPAPPQGRFSFASSARRLASSARSRLRFASSASSLLMELPASAAPPANWSCELVPPSSAEESPLSSAIIACLEASRADSASNR